MRRVALTLAVAVATLAGAAFALATRVGPAAIAVGRDLYQHRKILPRLTGARTTPGSEVVWLGDSTIVGRPGTFTYPFLIQRRELERRGMHSTILAAPGFDFYAYTSLMGPVLEVHPDVVIMVANLRLFPLGAGGGFNDLTALLPAGALPEMLALPFSFRGMTAPRLLLARLLRHQWAEDALLFVEGVRYQFQDAAFWEHAGPAALPVSKALGDKAAAALLRSYDAPIGPRHPLVRFAGAAVRMAVRGGAPVLVVVTPVPHEVLATKGLYDGPAYASRVGVLRDVVQANGGVFLDLHQAVPAGELYDIGAHFTNAGAAHMATLVWPALQPLLARATARSS
jgi:hypothetical protein